jgi:hypothetical protein
MAELKRDFTKYVRDGAKARYNKETYCEICGTIEELEFHHYKTLSVLVNAWVKKNKLNINTAEKAMKQRDVFISEHEDELYKHTVTLCKEHHSALHKVYGKNPSLGVAKKEERWVIRQKEKHNRG